MNYGPSHFAILLFASAGLGCTQSEAPSRPSAPEAPYANGTDIARLVAESARPALLEFCVPFGCHRCDEMRPSINELAQNEAGRVTVRRINLISEQQLAQEWGVTVCPTYIVVANGREVWRAAHPTSVDLVSAMIPNPPVTDSIRTDRTEANLGAPTKQREQ